jgi:hypothetical protein
VWIKKNRKKIFGRIFLRTFQKMIRFLLSTLLLWGVHSIGEPNDLETLYLSQYLHDPAQGQSLSRVVPNLGNTTSYSGYFTVNALVNSNMFFWFFESQDGNQDAPILIWYFSKKIKWNSNVQRLQGGPGGSSMFGLFGEIGKIIIIIWLFWTLHI